MVNIKSSSARSFLEFLAMSIFFVFCFTGFAYSHKINVFAWVEGDQVHVDAYFTKSAKVMNTQVKVLDLRGNPLLDGKTNEFGQYNFNLKDLREFPSDGLQVVIEEAEGHRAGYTLKGSDFREGLRSEDVKSVAVKGTSETKEIQGATEGSTKTDAQTNVAQTPGDLLRKVLAEELDSKLEPIERALAAQQRMLVEMRETGPSITEIIGGIGWVFGIFGIAGYFLSRRNISK